MDSIAAACVRDPVLKHPAQQVVEGGRLAVLVAHTNHFFELGKRRS